MAKLVAEILATEQIEQARLVGENRRSLAAKLERSQPFGAPDEDDLLFIDRWSCVAEKAVAEFLGLPWRNEILEDLSEKPPDVGERVEVKWTEYLSGWLIGHDDIPDEWVVVLVRGELPLMEIKGWTYGHAIKKERWKRNPKARNQDDYWYPPHRLLDVDLLLSPTILAKLASGV